MNKQRTEELAKEMLGRIADKWSLLVIEELSGRGTLRFSRLMEHVSGISQKMLTKTLRQMERDGLVTRTVYAEVPPRVDYALTNLGESLGEAVCGIWIWAQNHVEEVERARRAFAGKQRRAAS